MAVEDIKNDIQTVITEASEGVALQHRSDEDRQRLAGLALQIAETATGYVRKLKEADELHDRNTLCTLWEDSIEPGINRLDTEHPDVAQAKVHFRQGDESAKQAREIVGTLASRYNPTCDLYEELQRLAEKATALAIAAGGAVAQAESDAAIASFQSGIAHLESYRDGITGDA